MKLKITPILLKFVCLFLLAGCSSDDKDSPEVIEETGITTAEAFPALTFTSPVDIQTAPDGSNRLFVVEQAGTIKVFQNTAGVQTSSTFLDIKSKVTSGGERGLLGMTFHPDFKTNGYFYVNYTQGSPLKSVIARYKADTPSSSTAQAATETVLLTFSQPFDNHNGGSLQFGKDGYLYIATGDGGSGGDPNNNAQNKKSYLGKILRIDVNTTGKGNYGIPTDNPYAKNTDGNLEEIYAYGLRNPWKISFDPTTNQLFVADVGQDKREEINLVTKDGNYGWRVKEGINCYNPSSNCNTTGLTEPIHDYAQTNGDKSITGGYVYRGNAIKALVGKYIYGDYVSGRIWILELENSKKKTNSLLLENNGSISTFGRDESGEVYFANYRTGKLMKFAAK
ncbi:PQQ-dependent sugar dehydrogenase [Dyadobacter psychrotolerans]|uniref:Glucose sorbosone dehydrogenase n=1 Tax=Dyadobacter psychrotolerans TaxID=2541721 RepID=A0A4R5DSG7_9BACT|nr:PQQ-dependent sugar dehydrogenase [Dyadobacter psychrotolerans]TDE16677.1 glucose sorbosone dehydrogenase [Dyadobacter psychrotolerans]